MCTAQVGGWLARRSAQSLGLTSICQPGISNNEGKGYYPITKLLAEALGRARYTVTSGWWRGVLTPEMRT
ncbi:hypothetical protein PAXRUDRAFT_833980, partial [Paxillus rubicundulus Ve08.2h10]